MTKRKGIKGQTTINTPFHRKLKIVSDDCFAIPSRFPPFI